MQILTAVGVIWGSYLLGSIPFGLWVVKLATGKDIRQVASGRTGGTNAMRAAGCWAGLATAVFDMLKGCAAVWAAQGLTHEPWMAVLAPLAAVLGHNYSVFLAERGPTGQIRLRGGAGGAPAAGGAIGLWWPVLFGFPVPLLMFFGVGYASLTTLSIAVTVTLIFAARFLLGYTADWLPIVYGTATIFILAWALRPNFRALREGRERFHGWRPWKKPQPGTPDQQPPT